MTIYEMRIDLTFIRKITRQHPISTLYVSSKKLSMLRDITIQSIKHIFTVSETTNTQTEVCR